MEFKTSFAEAAPLTEAALRLAAEEGRVKGAALVCPGHDRPERGILRISISTSISANAYFGADEREKSGFGGEHTESNHRLMYT